MRIIFLCIFLLMVFSLQAQHGLHLRFSPEQTTAQYAQPAHILHGDAGFTFGTGASFWLNNSSLPFEDVFFDGDYVSSEIKTQLIGHLDTDNRFEQGLNLDYGIANFKLGEKVFSLSARGRQGVDFRFGNPLTAALILQGNAPYAGQEISDKDISFHSYSATEIGLGTGFWLGKTDSLGQKKAQLGIRAKVFLGNKFSAIDKLSYNFFTEKDGSFIQLQSEYDFSRPRKQATLQGLGFGLDLGALYQLSPKATIDLAITDLGFINWDAWRFQQKVDITYEGFELRDLIGEGSFDNLNLTDTARTLLTPDSVLQKNKMMLPTNFSIGWQQLLNEKSRLMASLHYSPFTAQPNTTLPLLSLAYHRDFGLLTLGANAYGGGVEQYGFGLLGKAKFGIGSHALNIFVAADNMLGTALPSTGKGLSLQAGVSVNNGVEKYAKKKKRILNGTSKF